MRILKIKDWIKTPEESQPEQFDVLLVMNSPGEEIVHVRRYKDKELFDIDEKVFYTRRKLRGHITRFNKDNIHIEFTHIKNGKTWSFITEINKIEKYVE